MNMKLCGLVAVVGIVSLSASPGRATTYTYQGNLITPSCSGDCSSGGNFGPGFVSAIVVLDFDTSNTSGAFDISGGDIFGNSKL